MTNIEWYRVKRLRNFIKPHIEIGLEAYLHQICSNSKYRLDLYIHTDFQELVIRIKRKNKNIYRELMTRLSFNDIRYVRSDNVMRMLRMRVEQLAEKVKEDEEL